jgi:uncharacterized membrane protein YfcA
MELYFALAVILITSFMFAPLGLGGGVLFVPTFYYILGWDLRLSIVSSLLLVWFVSVGSRRAHDQGGYTVTHVGRKGRILALFGAALGALLAQMLLSEFEDNALKIVAIGLLAWVIYRGLSKLKEEQQTDVSSEDCDPFIDGETLFKYRVGCLAGGISVGLIGFGGGMIFTMLNRTILRFEPHRAAGTSYLIVMRVVPIAVICHLLIEPALVDQLLALDSLAIFLPFVVLLAAWTGAKTAIKMLPQRVLTYPYLFAVAVGLVRYLMDIVELIEI